MTFVDAMMGTLDYQVGMGLLSGIYALGVLIPSFAVSIRRLHDIGRSGWWLLILFIPIAGAIIYLVFTLMDSQPHDNAFGPNPKAVADPAVS